MNRTALIVIAAMVVIVVAGIIIVNNMDSKIDFNGREISKDSVIYIQGKFGIDREKIQAEYRDSNYTLSDDLGTKLEEFERYFNVTTKIEDGELHVYAKSGTSSIITELKSKYNWLH